MDPALTSARRTGTRLTYTGFSGEMEGRFDPGGWLCAKMVYLSADSHRSKLQPLTGSPTHHHLIVNPMSYCYTTNSRRKGFLHNLTLIKISSINA